MNGRDISQTFYWPCCGISLLSHALLTKGHVHTMSIPKSTIYTLTIIMNISVPSRNLPKGISGMIHIHTFSDSQPPLNKLQGSLHSLLRTTNKGTMRSIKIRRLLFNPTLLNPDILQEQRVTVIIQSTDINTTTVKSFFFPSGGCSWTFECFESVRKHGGFEGWY